MNQPGEARKVNECSVAFLINQLGEVGDLLKELVDSDIRLIDIGEKLKKSGFYLSQSALRRHRARQTARGCACPR